MTNLQNSSFEEQVSSFTTGLVSAITALSPLLLMLIILGIAAANAFIEYLFQLSIFGSYAVAPAVLVGGFRFASGMGGITLIKSRAYIIGIAFFAVSLALTTYTWWHVETVARSIAPQAIEQATVTVSLILWGGFVGELMIAGYMSVASGNSLPAVTWWKTSGDQKKQEAVTANVNGTSNGKHH